MKDAWQINCCCTENLAATKSTSLHRPVMPGEHIRSPTAVGAWHGAKRRPQVFAVFEPPLRQVQFLIIFKFHTWSWIKPS
jgi:hypothetical protein